MNTHIQQFTYDVGCLAIRGTSVDAVGHTHRALQLIVPIEAQEYLLDIAGTRQKDSRAALINSRTRHALQANDILVLLIDPACHLGKVLGKQLLNGRDHHFFAHARAAMTANCTLDKALIDSILSALGLPVCRERHIEPRIQRLTELVLHMFKAGDGDQVNLDWAAAQVHLSRSRLQHVFRDQLDMPWRAWLLWQRLLHAALLAANGAPLTESAIAAGFSDAAHFSRTFKSTFGITPSAISLG